MLKKYSLAILITFILCTSCNSDDDSYIALVPDENEAYSGGETTIFDTSQSAFSFQAPNLTGDNTLFFFTGNSLFNQNWVAAPASTTARDGLGPFFNARACATCHFDDGRGRAPLYNGETSHGLLLRLSIPGQDVNGNNYPEPTYGGQLQDLSILNTETEASFNANYTESIVTYPDGTTASLRKPAYEITNLAYGNMAENVQISPRVANQMIGLGLLEAIPETTLLSFADEFDSDHDGISGRPNYVWNIETQSQTIGRFGWKANMPTIKQQVAGAFAGDLGITSSLFPDDNCPTGVNCNDYPNGGTPEIPDDNLDKVTLYSSVLAVPARRNHDNQNILEGKALFNQANCVACHKSKITTGNHPIGALANQTIRPYTDLLLHDMGEGLADNRPDFIANGNEWRTPPLWGIGLIETVNNHTNLLHDGRARTIEEAILWHDGEASEAKNKFINFSVSERLQVIDFIKSL